MNAILQEILATGVTVLPDGERVPIHSGVGPGSGSVLLAAVEAAKPKLGCEVGLAFGLSTLYILDAMQAHGGGRLIGVDPAQHDATWRGGGLHNVQRAGFADYYEFLEETSQLALPKLAGCGTRIQFGFIDGWHTFDHALVDFFFLDMMMDVGGVVVLDDVGYPGLQRLAHFIVSNRDYKLLALDRRPIPSGWRVTAKSGAQRLLRPLVRDNHSPTMETLKLQQPINTAQLIALQKRGDDRRRFDHFVPF